MARVNAFLRILKLAHKERRLLIGATVALLFTSSLNLLYPQLIQLIIDKVEPGGNTDVIDQYTILLFVLFLVISMIAALRMYLFEIAGERIVMRLRKQLFEALTNQDAAFFDQEKSGALLNRLAADTTLVQNAATVNLSMGLRFALAAVGSLIILAFTSLELTIVMLCIVPPAVVGTRVYGRWIRRLSVDVQEELAGANSVAEESISGIRTIRAFNATQRVRTRYGERIQRAFLVAKHRARSVSAFGAIAGFLGYSTVCGVLWYGGHLYVSGDLSLGQLTAFMLYTFTVAFSIGALGTVWQSLMKATGASERVFELIDQVPTVRSGCIKPSESVTTVCFENVCFAYPSRNDIAVLDGVSLTLKRGKKLAIVGPSGAGKSTIAALITRLYDPTEGQILVNNTPITQLDLSWWRNQLGVVFQEPILFAYSIRENLLLGKENATDEELWRALGAAQLEGFVRGLSDGLDTEVGERGVQLSGGQKQRLAIARLLVKDPPLVILDEATSALDSATETEIKTALRSLLFNRTALMIAHRLSTVIDADEIIYVEDGHIVDRGTHDQLMSSSVQYAHLVSAQLLNDPN